MAVTCAQIQNIAQESERDRQVLDMQAEAFFAKVGKILNSKDKKLKDAKK